MSHTKTSAISYKQLQQENKVLGNIISGLKARKNELEKHNEHLQQQIHQISSQQSQMIAENEALRNVTAELQNKLKSVCKDKGTNKQQQPSKPDLLSFLKATSERINNIESNLCSKPAIAVKVTPKSRAKTENELHCLRREVHKLEMEKLDLLSHNQQCVVQLQEIVSDQQSLQHKVSHLENENMRLRQEWIENNPSFMKLDKKEKSIDHKENLSQNLSNLSFEDIIHEIKRIEEENQCQNDLKSQIYALNDEVEKLRANTIEKQSENEALFNKYSVLLQQYNVLCNRYLK